jgi:hypothetical protein
MRCVLIATVALFVAMALVVAPPACAQSLPTLDEASALLKKAIDATNLKAPGEPPFHLVAKVRYTLDDKTTDGTYEILYAAPYRYRVELRLGAIGETNVALGDKFYIVRTTPTMTLPFWSLETFFWQPGILYVGIEPKAKRIYTSTVGAEVRTCVDAESEKAATKQICFDPASNAVVSISVKGKPPFGTPKNIEFENDLDDFVDLGPIRYPHQLVKKFVTETIEATVETFVAVDAFADSVFTPPEKAEVHDWCPSPVHENQPSKPPAPAHPNDHWLRMNALTAYYLLVGKDGYVKKGLLLHSSGDATSDKFAALLYKKTKLGIRTCGGKPIEYETIAVGGRMDPRFVPDGSGLPKGRSQEKNISPLP